MAIALRNAEHFMQEHERTGARRAQPAGAPAPTILVTGAPGWLGTRLVETIVEGTSVGAGKPAVRCLVRSSDDTRALGGSAIERSLGDLTDPA